MFPGENDKGEPITVLCASIVMDRMKQVTENDEPESEDEGAMKMKG